jgi:hypothetical protein
MLLGLSSAWTEGLNNGIKRYYAFDVTTSNKTIDSVTNAYLTGLNGSFKYGKINTGYMPNNESVNSTYKLGDVSGSDNTFSVSFWINRTSNFVSSQLIGNALPSGDSVQGLFFISIDANNNMSAMIYNGSSSYEAILGSIIPSNQWAFITFVYNGTNSIFYKDGVQSGIIQNFTNFNSHSNNISIFYFGRSDKTNYMINNSAIIDEIGIWNRSLSSSEISQLYNSGYGLQYSPTITTANISYDVRYVSPSYSGIQQYSILFNITNANLTPSYVIFNYKNVNYSLSISSSGGLYYSNKSLTINVTALENNQLYYFVGLSDGTMIKTIEYTQTINSVGLDSCSSFGNGLVNANLYDQDTLDKINGTIEALLNFYTNDGKIIAVYNGSFVNKTATICSNGIPEVAYYDYTFKYYSTASTGYQAQYYNVQHYTNLSDNSTIKLYPLLTSEATTFVITLKSADYSILKDSIIYVNRQYIPQNKFISVEAPKTDYDGKATIHLKVNNPVYNFVVYKDGINLGTFNNYLARCTGTTCEYTLNLITASYLPEDFSKFGDLSYTLSYNNATNLLSFQYSTISGSAKTIRMNVIRTDGYSNTSLCDESNYGSIGTINCNIVRGYGNNTIYANIYSDGKFLISEYFSIDVSPTDIYGGTRIIFVVLMFCSLVFLFVGDPIMMIVGGLLGMIFAGALHLTSGGEYIGFILISIWLVIASAIIIYLLSRRKPY